LQGPHGFDRVDCRIAHPTRNRPVVEALHVLQGEVASRDVGTDLLDHTMTVDQRLGDRVVNEGLSRYRRRISRTPIFRQSLFKVEWRSALAPDLFTTLGLDLPR